MALQKGEHYRCPDPDCGCELEVVKGAAPGKGGDQAPRCCCGKAIPDPMGRRGAVSAAQIWREARADIPNASLIRVKDAHHSVMIDKPDEFIRHVSI